tara:strand:- start:2239 stop:3126 length:888 start_codon:yes stop_codon:yes gene_type:complete
VLYSISLETPVQEALIAGAGSIDGFNVSYDGSLIAFYNRAAATGKFENHVRTTSGESLASFDHAEYQVSPPYISPNNQYVAFLTLPERSEVEGFIRIYTLEGVLVRTIEDNLAEGLNAFAITWTRDGALLISSRQKGLYIVDDPLASEPRLIKPTPNETMLTPRISPDASKIAFSAASNGQLHVWDVGTEDFRQITNHSVPDGYSLFIEGLDWSPDSRYILANVHHTKSESCLGISTVIIDQAADKAILPDRFTFTSSEYTNPDIFEVEYYPPGRGANGHTIQGLCSRGDLDWRE